MRKIRKFIWILTAISMILLTQTVYAEENDIKEISVIYADALDKTNQQTIEVGIAPGQEVEEEETNIYQNIKISDSEFALLREILALEAQNEGLYGEMACCEVIFNRVLNDGWGSTVEEVLKKPGQFSTLRIIGTKKAWAHAGELEDDAISEVLRTGPSILPDTSYIYFDTKAKNGKQHVRIGTHYFGKG